MELFTLQIGKWRVARAHQIPMVDTTVKSGERIFAPTWDIVLGHKNGSVSDEAYTKEYRRLMIESMKAHRDQWERFVADPEPKALACYCPAGKFCHRHLLVKLFEEICTKRGLPFHYYGELE